jgi:lipopolysaccharide biosynthesis regulator YciM
MTSLAEVVRLATDRAGEARIGDLYAADHDWEWAIAAYRRAITDQPTDDALLDKLATAYQEDGRTREVVPVLASKLATDSNDTLLLPNFD